MSEPTIFSCPFCDEHNRLKIISKWGSGEGNWRPRVSYVTCMKCHARGPAVKSVRYDVRNEKPSMGSVQLNHEAAIEAWNGFAYGVRRKVELQSLNEVFRLESEVEK